MTTFKAMISTYMLVGLLAVTANAVTIATVPVGDPGNAADPINSFGSVGYTYNIGTYEVTAGQYTEFLNAVAKTDTYDLYSTYMSSDNQSCRIHRTGSSGSYTYSVSAAYANRPVNFVSWGDAARFANWLHNNQPAGAQDLTTTENGAYYLNGASTDAALLAVTRKADWRWAITSEDEWYKAAYYKGGSTNAGYWDYPTHSNTLPGRDLADVSGNNANYFTGFAPFPIDSPHYTTVVGEFQNSASPYGTFDQGGNVFEWTEAIIPRFNSGLERGIRGGSYLHTSDYLLRSHRPSYYPTGEYYDIGFRVSDVPEPGCAMMILCGGFALLKRRSRR